VTVDRETTTHADHVGTDEELGGRLVAEHLLSLKHKHVAHVTFPHRTANVLRRGEAFCKVIEKAGGDCQIVQGAAEELVSLIRKVLQQPNRPTAVFTSTDPMAMQAYSAAASLGLRIPQDLSIVGYADFPFARDLWPPLTSVRQDPYQMGRKAAQMLLDRVLERVGNDTPKRVHLKPELIVRESTGPASE
jgi:LacI family transcriptional regulator